MPNYGMVQLLEPHPDPSKLILAELHFIASLSFLAPYASDFRLGGIPQVEARLQAQCWPRREPPARPPPNFPLELAAEVRR